MTHHSIIIFGSELTFVAEFIYTETVKTVFLFYPNEIPREYCHLQYFLYLCIIVRRTLNSQANKTENIMSYIQEQHPYLAPEVEVVEAIVEQGFQNSNEDPILDPEQGW